MSFWHFKELDDLYNIGIYILHVHTSVRRVGKRLRHGENTTTHKIRSVNLMVSQSVRKM